jgi:hypothetical protein
MLSDSDSAEVLAMLIRETVRAYARTRALHGMLALTIAALLSCGCVIIDVPIYPDEWTRVHREGEGSCPDLTGTYAASGRESGLIKLFWFLPFWWSSNAQSIPRLDQDLGLSLEWGRPLAIEGAIAIQFDQADPGRIWFTVLRGDGSQIEEFDDVGFTRTSSRLDDSAHVFVCREGWIEFGYEYHSGELDRWANFRITRLANGPMRPGLPQRDVEGVLRHRAKINLP